MTYATTQNTSRPSVLAGVANADLAATILRVSMGVLFLAHAGLKLFIFTPAGTAGYFASHHSGAGPHHAEFCHRAEPGHPEPHRAACGHRRGRRCRINGRDRPRI